MLKNRVELPKLKHSRSQGKIGYSFLEIVDKKQFRKVAEVRQEFRQVVIQDKERRANQSEGLLKSFKKQMITKQGEEKLFDSEYCRLLDYLEAFDIVSLQGGMLNQEITLNYFGSMVLENSKANQVEDIFENCNRDILARIYMFIDSFKKWNLIQVIKTKQPVKIEQLIQILIKHGVGCDLEKIKKDIIAKPEFRQQLRDDWERTHKTKNIDYRWKNEHTENITKAMIEKRQEHYILAILGLYSEIGLLNKEKGEYSCNSPYIETLHKAKYWITSDELDLDHFFEETVAVYKKASNERGTSSIPIPVLRKEVCKKVRILWPTFDKVIAQYINGFKGIQLSLTRASARRKWGITIGGYPYYYIGIYKKGVH